MTSTNSAGGVRPEKTWTLLKLRGRWISCGMLARFLPLFRLEPPKKEELLEAWLAPSGFPQASPSLTSSWYSRLNRGGVSNRNKKGGREHKRKYLRLHVWKLGMTVLGRGTLFQMASGRTTSVPTASSGLDRGMERPWRETITQRFNSLLTKS